MIQENQKWNLWYGAASLAVVTGIVLTIISWMKICSTSCNDAHNYRLFGMPFEVGGAGFFALLSFCHFGSLKWPSLSRFMPFLIAVGLGAEAYFIAVQKFQIGSWCPVCLSIAASIAVLGICYWGLNKNQGDQMYQIKKLASITAIFCMGFATAYLGMGKIDQLQAVEDQIKEKIRFGNSSSPVEVFVFTDWACPACRAIEPALEKMAPKIMEVAQLTFVATVVHPETLNYAPYDLSFMVNDKKKYFEIREALTKLSLTNKKPNDQQISKAIAPLRVSYKELPYEDVSVAMRYFDELVERFKITATPTVAIVNLKAKKGKKLAGADEITEANVLKAINSLR